MVELKPEHLFTGAPDVNPTICYWCKAPHSRISPFCSNKCRKAFHKSRQRQADRAKKAAKLEDLA